MVSSSSSSSVNDSNRSNFDPIDPRDFERRPSTPVRSRSSPEKKPICSGLSTFNPLSPSLSQTQSHYSPSIYSTPTTTTSKNLNPNRNNSSSKFTPTKKHPINLNHQSSSHTNPTHIKPSSSSLSTPNTPTRLRTNTFISLSTKSTTHQPIIRSPQSIHPPLGSSTSISSNIIKPINSPLRASLTAEAIPRKRQILPGAPNPPGHRIRVKSLKSPSSPFASPLSSSHHHLNQSPSSLNRSQSHLNLFQSQSHSARPSSLLFSPSLCIQSHQPSPTQSPSCFQPLDQEPPTGKAQLENVLVAIRVKGLVDSPTEPQKLCWSIDSDQTQISEILPSFNLNQSINPTSGPSWNFDSVLGPNTTNEEAYNKSGARDLILSAMAGYDATIFAYGQTASGKTHTLTGSAQQPGIIPLAVQEMFSFIRSHPEREFLLRVSYLEVYNEQIHDLLLPTTQPSAAVKIRQSANGTFFADPVREEVVTNAVQVASLMARGEKHRHVAGTDWNARSSRSHTVFGIVIESRFNAVDAAVRRSKVCLIDLAGNERASSEVERRSEGAFINKSLLTLEKVISALAEPNGSAKKRSQHIPYRDSKLTQILQPSLSGESRVCVICTMNGTFKSVEDSRSTLRFASRVKKIQTSAGVNEILTDSALIIRYRQQITDLQSQLTEAVKKANYIAPNINHDQLADKACPPKSSDDSQIQAAEEERAKIKKQLKELQSIILNADNLDQVEGLSKETRPVSPVKKRSGLALEYDSDSDSVISEQSGPDGKAEMGSKEKRKQLELEEKVELQAYEIACLRLELLGIKHRSNNSNPSPGNSEDQEGDHDHQTVDFGDKREDAHELEIEQAVKRVAESREALENRLADLSLEIKKRKKFTQDVLNLLDASRSKTRKLELFILNEIERSTRRLSKIERNAFLKHNNENEPMTSSRGARRRSSSINSNPYQLLMMSNSTNHLIGPPTKRGASGTQPKDRDLVEPDEDNEQKEENQDISSLLSIVNELPELELVRMSFGGSGNVGSPDGTRPGPHPLHH